MGLNDTGSYEFIRNPDGTWSMQTHQTGSNIQQPTDLHSIFKPLLFNTTATLAASATYTSPTIDSSLFDVNGTKVSFGRVTGRAFASVVGNVYMDVSDDGTAWDQVYTAAVAANGIVPIDQIVVARYVRFRYINGAAAQTANNFRFSAYGRPQ